MDAERLDLPGARRRQLQVAVEWEREAGAWIARRAPALALRRGVLDVAVPHEGWEPTLTALLPVLAARLAARCPQLGIRRVRLVPEGEAAPARAQALPDLGADQGVAAPASRNGTSAAAAAPAASRTSTRIR